MGTGTDHGINIQNNYSKLDFINTGILVEVRIPKFGIEIRISLKDKRSRKLHKKLLPGQKTLF